MAKKTPSEIADRILRLVRKHGSDADDVRDAAHEASHALQLGIPKGSWDRETIHAAVMKLSPAERGVTEVLARAVEAEICALCQTPYNQDYFLMLAVIEALKSGVRLPNEFKEIVEEARTRSFQVRWLVRRVRALR